MSRVLYPTVWLGLGPLGPRVVDRALSALDGPQPLLAAISDPAALTATLEPLLRAGRERGTLGEPRLDLVAFASVLEGEDGALVAACEALAAAIRAHYAVLFPPDRPPEQRTAGLQLVLLAPPLSDGPVARMALRRLLALERWAEGRPPMPLLARIWLVSEQTAAGTLSAEEQIATAAAFAVAAFGAGLRDAEPLRVRLCHPAPTEGRIGLLSLASLDVPEGPLHRYALERAALDGLSTLVARAGRPVEDPGVADAAVAKIALPKALGAVREAAAGLRPRGDMPLSLEVPKVGVFDTPEAIRARWPELLSPRKARHAEEVAEALDRAEGVASAQVRDALDERLSHALGSTGGLRPLPDVEVGLRGLLRGLPGTSSVGSGPLESGGESAELATLDTALRALPAPGPLRFGAAVLGLSIAWPVAMLGFAALAPGAAPSAAALAAPVIGGATAGVAGSWADLLPWGLGLVAGLAAAATFVALAGRAARARVVALLAERQAALRAPVLPPELSDRGIAAREDRLRRIAVREIGEALARLDAARQILIAGRDGRQAALSAMGIHPTPDPATDDLRPLHGGGGALHGALVPPEALARWAARCRAVVERDRWADQLLAACPGGEGDVPCADADQIDAAARVQVAPLGARSVFDDPDVSDAIATAVRAFSARIPLALGAAVTPRDASGDPVAGLRPGAVLTVGPASGRSALASALADAPVAVEMLWTPVQAPRLLFLRTWEGFRVAQIARGAGMADLEGTP